MTAASKDIQDIALFELEQCGALLDGHFILSSGLRSPRYVQCARALMDPWRATYLVEMLAHHLRGHGLWYHRIDAIVSPAMGGVVFGHELGRQMHRRSMFVERVSGQFAFRRGFSLHPDDRVLVAEDVVTTGLSTRECMLCCQEEGARVVGVTSLIDRSGGDVDFDVPFHSLVRLDIPTYRPDALPPELEAIPPFKPGSRTGPSRG